MQTTKTKRTNNYFRYWYYFGPPLRGWVVSFNQDYLPIAVSQKDVDMVDDKWWIQNNAKKIIIYDTI